MKESPRRYTNPFLSDEENERLNLWSQEFEHSNIELDTLTNSLGPPSEFCEKETELYTDKNVMECEFPELLICYKDGAFQVKDICVDEGIPHGERFLFDENDNDEMLNPEQLKFPPMEDYYMESNLRSETELKIDTGLPVLVPSIDHKNIGDHHDEVTKRKSDAFCGTREVDADLPLNEPINDHTNTGNISIDTEIPAEDLQDSITDYKEYGYKEEVSDSLGLNDLKEISKEDTNDENGVSKSAPDGFTVSSESMIVSKVTENNSPDISVQSDEKNTHSRNDLSDNVSTEQAVSNSGPSLEQDRLFPSLKSLLESIDQQPCQSPVDERGNMVEENDTSNLNNIKSATTSEHTNNNIENLERSTRFTVDGLSIEQHGAPKLQDVDSDNVATVNQVNRGEGESSFSVVGPVSEITYSGPIAFSGSASLRSDSSTTSTRSFAFPILQNEWNSSPVRMAKADRRRLQKHRGWKHGLLCCRF